MKLKIAFLGVLATIVLTAPLWGQVVTGGGGSGSSAGGGGTVIVGPNEGVTGTTPNLLVKFTGAPSTAITIATTDTQNILGPCVSSCGTTGSAVVAEAGIASCLFDNATVAGDHVIASTSAAGDCHDTGFAFKPAGSQDLGIVLSTNGSGGTYQYNVQPPNQMNGPISNTPQWLRWVGNGEDGAGPASGAWGAATFEKHFTSWTCTGNITSSNNTSIIVRSQGAVALNTGCTINVASKSSAKGDMGGAGGSGGSGAANSAASQASAWWNPTGGTPSASTVVSALAAASAAGAGNAGGVISATNIEMLTSIGMAYAPLGGSPGTGGGSSGGAAGNGGGCVIIVAPTITIASGVTINVAGGPGVAPTANSTGAGGGGGGGCIVLAAQSITDSGGIYNYAGGPAGAITQPSIQVGGSAGNSSGCDTGTNGCGTGALLTVTGVTTGGLDASKVSIANAGSGYQSAPSCNVNAGGSGLTGSPACHFTLSGGTIASIVIDTAGSGATLTTFTTAFVGGYGANGWMREYTIK